MLTAQQLLAAIQESAPLQVVQRLYALLILERCAHSPLRAGRTLGIAARSIYNWLEEAGLDVRLLRQRPVQAETEEALVALVQVMRPWPVSSAQAGAQLLMPESEAHQRLSDLTHTGLVERLRGTTPGTPSLFHARESL